MLTIRNNLFETNSSSTHSFSFRLSFALISVEEALEQLDIKDGVLKIPGSVKCHALCFVSKLPDKLSLIATHIEANDDEKLKTVFEDTIKKYLPSINQIEYNVIFSGKARNACYNPYLIDSDINYNYTDEIEEDDQDSELRELLFNPKYMKMFLFGAKSSIEGKVDYDG